MYYADKKNQGSFRMAAIALAMALVFSCLLPVQARAARSRAGGGEVAKADTGDIATSIGVSVGSAIGMQVLSGAFNSASQATTNQQYMQSIPKLTSELNTLSTQSTLGPGLQQQAANIQRAIEAKEILTATDSVSKNAAVLAEIKTLGENAYKQTGLINQIGTTIKTANSGGIIHALSSAGKVVTNPTYLGQGISSVINFSAVMPTVVSGYNSYVATSQVSRAAGMAGYYYGWKPTTTFVVSSAFTGGVTGLLNPEIAMATDKINPNAAWPMVRGAAVGSLGGLGGSLGTVAVDRKRIDAGESPSALGLITGNITGLSATLFGRTLTSPDTYHKISSGFFEKKRSGELAAEDPKIQEMQKQIQLKTEGLMSDEEIDEAVSSLRGSKSEIAIVSRQEALREEVAVLKQRMANYKNTAYGQEYAYRRIIGVDSDGRRDYNVLPDHFFDEFYAGYKPVPTGIPEVFAMEKTVDKVGWGNLLGRYAKSAFIEPFSSQNLPILASQSLAIWATSRLPKDKAYLAPLAQNMIFGMSSPVFRSLAATYGIDFGLLLGRLGVGSKNDIMMARMRYDYGVRAMAENERMAKVAKEIYGISDQYRRGEIKFEEYEDALNKINTDLNGPDARQLALFDPDRMINKTPEEKKAYIKEQLSLVSLEGLSAQERKQQEEALSKAITDFLPKPMDRRSVVDMNFNLSEQLIGKSLRFGMSGGSINEALQAAGMSRNKLLLANSWRGAVSGAFEGSISGGIESAFDKNYPAGEGSVATQFFRPYAANMITAVIRGASWHYNWNEMSRQWDWYDKWDSLRPESYALSPGDQGYNRIDEELSRLGYGQSMLRHKRALYAAGAVEKELPQSKWEVQDVIMNKDGGIDKVIWRERIVNVPTLTLSYSRGPIMGKPTLSEAIARSLEQANMDYFATTFSFGRPLIRGNSPTEVFGTSPENISAYSYMVNLNNLNNLANKGLSELILYQARAANIGSTTQIGGTQTGAAAKNIMSSIVAIPGAAGLVNMQPERFVKVTTSAGELEPGEASKEVEAPGLPSTVQQASFAGPGAHIEFDTWVPFPNPAYSPEAQHGAPLNFLRNTRKESVSSVPTEESFTPWPQKIEQPKVEMPASLPEAPVDIKQEIAEFKGAVAAANTGQISLTPEQALESNNVISFRLDGDLSFRPGGAPPQVTPIYGPMVGPKDALPVPYLGPKEDPGIIGADGTHYFTNNDNETALAIKPAQNGDIEFSIVPSYQVPIAPLPLVTAPGNNKPASTTAAPQVVTPAVPAASATSPGNTVEISASVNGPVVSERK